MLFYKVIASDILFANGRYFNKCFIFVGLDQFVEPLKTTCTLKVKANSVKQEYEKQDELKRSALRALAALASIPKAGKYAEFVSVLDQILIFSHLFQTKINS